MKRLDLVNRKIGILTVLNYSHSHIQPSGQKRAMWDVLCECGVKKKMSTGTLTNGTISCGCVFNKKRKEGLRKIEFGEANFNYKYISYKHSAKNRNIDFCLTKDEFRGIIIKKCNYCNLEGKLHHTKRSENGLFVSNGIDRVDSSKGYFLDNCVPCCKVCNIMKSSLTKDEFIEHIRRIYNFNKLC
jgi:hypothetical protein